MRPRRTRPSPGSLRSPSHWARSAWPRRPARLARPPTPSLTNTTDSPFTTSNPSELNPDYARSLLLAIQAANLNPGHDAIRFDVPGAGVHTIRPRSTNRAAW
jgi:hypothetical protein